MKILLAVLLVTLAGCSKKAPDAAALEDQFREMMTGAALVGHSTFDNRDNLSGEERYAIDGVTKLGGDTWMLRTRMRLGGHEVPLPIPVTVKWAGDTPVITLTDASIPGFGTYTARVVLYRDRYAGTWSGSHGNGKNFGGQLFGKIVHEHSQ